MNTETGPSQLPPLEWLRVFDAAARTGNFTAAADELGLTQAAVSQRMRHLEARLGAALFKRLPRGVELTGEGEAYAPHEAEALAAGGELSGQKVISLLSGEVRPEMVAALSNVSVRYKTACLTNNVKASTRPPHKQARIDDIMQIFGVVVESSKVGVRKPVPEFYRQACAMLEIKPEQAIFLDDLGINLKPAREMGMATIKVTSAA